MHLGSVEGSLNVLDTNLFDHRYFDSMGLSFSQFRKVDAGAHLFNTLRERQLMDFAILFMLCFSLRV